MIQTFVETRHQHTQQQQQKQHTYLAYSQIRPFRQYPGINKRQINPQDILHGDPRLLWDLLLSTARTTVTVRVSSVK